MMNSKKILTGCNQSYLKGGFRLRRTCGSLCSGTGKSHASSRSSYGSIPTTGSSACNNPSVRNNAPPTTPMKSLLSRQSQVVLLAKQESPTISSTFMNTGALDPSSLIREKWLRDTTMMNEPLGFSHPMYGFENFNSCDQTRTSEDVSPSDPMMPDWNDIFDPDFNNFI